MRTLPFCKKRHVGGLVMPTKKHEHTCLDNVKPSSLLFKKLAKFCGSLGLVANTHLLVQKECEEKPKVGGEKRVVYIEIGR
ncbi:hypothetical protein L6452_44399 [Arctium lappa]|uniref:Uncharacterized protein n=1 Tax=Arctium lappa TaxID=4217 RepID=A0ACB8XGB0_ARCLA|nr:hypothetical protein L6452_44399 [Arctium lappa]